MSNTLSKRICKLCNVKPHYGVWENFGDLDNDYNLVTNERKYRLIADTRYHYGVEDEDLKDLKPIYIPNFMYPPNFVQLYELKLQSEEFGSLGYEVCSGKPFINRRQFLTTLASFISVKSKYRCQNTKLVNEIKQAIKQSEWSFEDYGL